MNSWCEYLLLSFGLARPTLLVHLFCDKVLANEEVWLYTYIDKMLFPMMPT